MTSDKSIIVASPSNYITVSSDSSLMNNNLEIVDYWSGVITPVGNDLETFRDEPEKWESVAFGGSRRSTPAVT